MKVIILAAGLSERLRAFTGGQPKPLLTIGRKSLLERTVASCVELGLDDFIVVAGYQYHLVQTALLQLAQNYNLYYKLLLNPHYAIMNNCHSLLLGLNECNKDDALIINADVLFEPRVIKTVIGSTQTALAVDSTAHLDPETMKVLSDGSRLLGLDKDLDAGSSYGEYIGISLIKNQDITVLAKTLGEVVATSPQSYYEAAFQILCNHRIIKVINIAGLNWTEIDTEDDVKQAEEIVKKWD